MYHVTTTLAGRRIMVLKDSLIPRTAAYGLLIENGKILLLRLKTTNKLWFPGGKVESEESLENGLVREFLEETNLVVSIEKKLFEVETSFFYEGTGDAFAQTATYFLVRKSNSESAEIKVNDVTDETHKPEWYDLADLKEEAFQDYAYFVIEKYKEMSKNR